MPNSRRHDDPVAPDQGDPRSPPASSLPPPGYGDAPRLEPTHRPPPSAASAASHRSRTHGCAHRLLIGVLFLVGLVALVFVFGAQDTPLPGLAGPPPSSVPIATLAPTIPQPPTTTIPERALLTGRPTSPVVADEAACASGLGAGRLFPLDWTAWEDADPATPTPLTDDEIRDEIATVMRNRFPGHPTAPADAISIYDSSRLRTVTGDEPVLRAGLTLLKGTVGEPALAFILDSDGPSRFDFGTVSSAEGVSAEAWGDTANVVVTVAEGLRNDRPVLLAPLLFHEILHQDGVVAQQEEVIANSLEVLVAMEQLRDAPWALDTATNWARVTRWRVLAMLNTRIGPTMSVTVSDATTVFPNTLGDAPATFAESVKWATVYATVPDEPSPGSTMLTEILAQLAADANGHPDPAEFDSATLDFLNGRQGVAVCDQATAATVLGVLSAGPARDVGEHYLAGIGG